MTTLCHCLQSIMRRVRDGRDGFGDSGTTSPALALAPLAAACKFLHRGPEVGDVGLDHLGREDVDHAHLRSVVHRGLQVAVFVGRFGCIHGAALGDAEWGRIPF